MEFVTGCMRQLRGGHSACLFARLSAPWELGDGRIPDHQGAKLVIPANDYVGLNLRPVARASAHWMGTDPAERLVGESIEALRHTAPFALSACDQL